MRKRSGGDLPEEPPKKRISSSVLTPTVDFKRGDILTDIVNNKWTLGKPLGVGGFGQIYLVTDSRGKSDYVAKVEEHQNGPLFVEINCYLRIARPHLIADWTRSKHLDRLGMPHYVASGSHWHKEKKYRFLILPKFNKDLEKILTEKRVLNLETVLTISHQIIDILEYIHEKGYIHSDIKASNILLDSKTQFEKPTNKYANCLRSRKKQNVKYGKLRPPKQINYRELEKNGSTLPQTENEVKPPKEQVYLLDYGLASRFLHTNGKLKEYCEDERRAHAGTVLFCSCDAHKGVQSRRSDLESLGYNIIYWLTGSLPWLNNIEDPESVAKIKGRLLKNPQDLLQACFDKDYPVFLLDYFKYLNNLKFENKPDYDYCKSLFRKTVNDYKDNFVLDFDNQEGWGLKLKKPKTNKGNRENLNIKIKSVFKEPRIPLQSNIPVKPLLRKAKKINQRMTWSKILVDPETIFKRKPKKNDSEKDTPNVANLDIYSLNPTNAMLEIYNKFKEKNGYSPKERGDFSDFLPGYTPAMMEVHKAMMERQELESLKLNNGKILINKKTRNGKGRKKHQPQPLKVPTKTKSVKSISVKKDAQIKKVKSAPLRRNYSLRG